MLKSFLYAVLNVYIYIRSDWYEPVTFFVYIESRISYYTRSLRQDAHSRELELYQKNTILVHCVLSRNSESVTIKL